MGLCRTLVLAALVFGASGIACAGVIGLSDFEIVEGLPDASLDAGNGGLNDGGSLTTADGITITPTELTIPPASCADPSTATFTIANSGVVQTSYSATVATAGFTIQNGQGYIAPGATVTVTVMATGPTDGTASADVTVTTGTAAVPVHVSYASSGGQVTITPSTVDFGTIHDAVQSAPSNTTVTNNGTSDIIVTGLMGMTADFDASVPFTIPAGGIATEAFTMNAGTVATAQATVGFKTTTALCGTAPQLLLRGNRTTADITVSPATLNLGDIPCSGGFGGGTTSATGTITISNYGGTTPSFNASAGGQFPVSPGSGTVPAASSASAPGIVPLTVSFNGPTSGPETLQQTINVNVNGSNTNVTVNARVAGAAFSSPGGNVNVEGKLPTSVPIRNTGNVTACVVYALTGDTHHYFELSVTTDSILAGGTGTLQLTYSGPSDGGYRGSQVTATLVACTGASAPVAVCGSAIRPIDLIGR